MKPLDTAGQQTLLGRAVDRIVAGACRWPRVTVLLVLSLAAICATFAVYHFAINTDSGQLISAQLPWRQRELAFDKAFPQRTELIEVVIDGKTPEQAEIASRQLTQALASHSDAIASATRPGTGPFFSRNGLLFLPLSDVERTTEQLIRAQPFIGSLNADPTMRGLLKTLAFIPAGVQSGDVKLNDFAKPLHGLADTFESALQSHAPVPFSFAELMTGQTAGKSELRRFIAVKPKLDFGALEPGAAAANAIRGEALRLGFTPDSGVTVRLTGPVALDDEEFATVANGATLNAVLTVLAVLILIWLALRSVKLIVAVFVSLSAGLVMTAAAGLAMVGAFNLISVAFAVLFIGIGVDFGIQYCVRYREERHSLGALEPAIRSAARRSGLPLALAAGATTAGFFAFLPTDYRGVSELGLVAGTGMIIAFLTSITVLPALLTLLQPPGEPHEIGYRWLAPVDRALARHRVAVLILTGLAVAAGVPSLTKLRFDFNPLNLKSAKVESVRTLLDLMADPATSPNTIEVLAPDLNAARPLTLTLGKLPEVARAITLDSFVPGGQKEKLAVIADANALLGPTLVPPPPQPEPTGVEIIAALRATGDAYAGIADPPDAAEPAAVDARRLAKALHSLATASTKARERAAGALVPGMGITLEQIRDALKAEPVSLDKLPADLKRDWLTADGHALIELSPAGDGNDNATLRRFATSVLAIAPEATGVPVLIQESARTVVAAFIEAGFLAFASITVLLYVVLRRWSDVFLTLAPLILAGLVTLEICGAIDMPLNFANIIALPLLLGVGVAFKIYYVLAWRAGATSLLASSLTRAVFYSALTTATAFGSLWSSSHPGTSSMGKLMLLSLVTTLLAAVIFQPVLMGPPRVKKEPAAG